MAPLPTIPNVYRISLDWLEGGSHQIAENVIHVLAAGSDAATVVAAVDAANHTGMNAPAVSSASVQTMHCTPLDGSSATVLHTVTGTHWAGLDTGDFVPNAAPVLSMYTAKRGRSYRGRIYLPFMAEEDYSDGVISGAVQGDIITAWTAWMTTLIAGSIHPVVASYKHSTAEPITSFQVKQAVGTQRRRQTRVRYP